jgi:hypothetical protein
MKRASLCFATIAVIVLGGAAGYSGLSEPQQPTNERHAPPEAVPPKAEPRPPDADEGHWGRLQGRVTFNGRFLEPRIIADPDEKHIRRMSGHEVIFGKRDVPIRSEQFVIDVETRGVRSTLVYLVRPTAVREAARRSAPSTLPFQADRGRFVPHVLAAMEGAEILVSTHDPVHYNLHAQLTGAKFLVEDNDSRSAIPRVLSHGNEMNYLFGNFPDGRLVSLKVQPAAGRPRPIPVLDDIHTWMSAWWLVLDHPYFAVTNERGIFEIRDVPAGPQQLVVWHESVEPGGRALLFQGEIVIRGEGVTVQDFVIESGQIRTADRAINGL